MSTTGLMQMIEKGTYPPVLLLYGKEVYLRDHYAHRIRASAVTQMPELNCSEFSELPYSIETLREAVQTIPFLDERRLVILRSCQLFATEQSDFAKKLAELIPQIPKTTLLLILEGELTGKSVPKSPLFTAIAEHGHTYELTHPSAADMVAWTNREFARLDKKIRVSDIEYLLSVCPDELITLKNEIDKIAAYAGETQVISREHIDAVVTKTPSANAFLMVEQALGGNVAQAITQFRTLLRLGEEPVGLFSLFGTQLLTLLKIRICHDAGQNNAAIAATLKKPEWTIRKNLSLAKRYSASQLLAVLEAYNEAYLSIMSGKSNGALAFELFLASAF